MRTIQRLLQRLYDLPPDLVLNRGPALAAPSSALAADLYRLTNQLKAEAFDLSRGSVNYERVHVSETYAAYQASAAAADL